MVLLTDENFFVTTSKGLWGDIDPRILPRSVLDTEIDSALAAWRKEYPSQAPNTGLSALVVIAVIAVVCVAAVAASSAGAASTATAGTTSTAAASTGAVTTTTAAAGAGQAVTVSQAYGYVQTAAGYAGKVAAIGRTLRGDSAPSDLERVANVVAGSSDVNDAATKLAQQVIAQQTSRRMTDTEREVLAERIRRAQADYAAQLRAKAQRMRQGETAGAMPAAGWEKYLPLALPILVLLGRG